MSVVQSPQANALAVVEAAFAPGGAVERVLSEHRPAQAAGAYDLMALLLAGRQRDGRPRLYVRQIGAGLGKTFMLLFVAAVYHGDTGHRVLVCTSERQLRADMLAAMPAVNAVLHVTRRALRQPSGIAVGCAEQKSKLGFASLRKAAALPKLLMTRSFDATEQQRLRAYTDWLSTTESFELADFVEQEGALPLDCSELDLGLTQADIGTPPYQRFLDNREACAQAPIVLATHAMALRNNLSQGRVLDTLDAGPRRFAVMLVDEADSLISAARSVRTFSLALDEIDADARRIEQADVKRHDVAAAALHLPRRLSAVRRFLLRQLGGANHLTISGKDAALPDVLAQIETLHSGVAALMDACTQADDLITAERFQRAAEAIEQIRRWATQLHQRAPRAGLNTLVINNVSNGLRQGLVIGMQVSHPGFVVNPLWRAREGGNAAYPHHLDSIVLVSATLRGSNDRHDAFFGAVGIDEARDTPLVDDDLVDREFGLIRRVVYADRDPALLPIVVEDDIAAENPDHLRYVAEAIRRAFEDGAKQPTHRILVLSYTVRAARDLFTQLRDYGLADHLFMATRKDANIAASFAAKPHGIWLTWHWTGFNPVTDHTLVDAVMVVRLPIAPAVAQRSSETAEARSWAIYNAVEDAFRNLTQGIARGVRRRNDVIDLWLLDPRIPLPDELARGLQMPKWVAGASPYIYRRFADAIRIRCATTPNSRGVLLRNGRIVYPDAPRPVFAQRFGRS